MAESGANGILASHTKIGYDNAENSARYRGGYPSQLRIPDCGAFLDRKFTAPYAPSLCSTQLMREDAEFCDYELPKHAPCSAPCVSYGPQAVL